MKLYWIDWDNRLKEGVVNTVINGTVIFENFVWQYEKDCYKTPQEAYENHIIKCQKQIDEQQEAKRQIDMKISNLEYHIKYSKFYLESTPFRWKKDFHTQLGSHYVGFSQGNEDRAIFTEEEGKLYLTLSNGDTTEYVNPDFLEILS